MQSCHESDMILFTVESNSKELPAGQSTSAFQTLFGAKRVGRPCTLRDEGLTVKQQEGSQEKGSAPAPKRKKIAARGAAAGDIFQ